jgi:Mg-chelatase subunit ChlD
MSDTQSISQDIIVILDESGSMASMGNEPKQAINSFIKDQQQTLNDEATFSLWKFNTGVSKVVDDEKLSQVKEFTDFNPYGMTALLDAIGEAIITKRNKEKNHNVICVILTDGVENSSKKYTSDDIRRMTKEMEEEFNWKFLYLGANQDSFNVGGGYGMNLNRCANFTCEPGNLDRITRSASSAISNYRTLSAAVNETPVDLRLPPNEDAPNKVVSAPARNSLKLQRSTGLSRVSSK